VPLAHVRHEHRGFRAAEIRNRAIAQSRAPIAYFLDGDCIPRADFIARHRGSPSPAGSLPATAFCCRKIDRGGAGAGTRARTMDHGGAVRPRRASIAWRPAASAARHLRKIAPARWEGARTCNLAVARRDLDRVDGFDASFNGWGLEDSDLAIRLIMRACGARTDDLPPACSTCGISPATARNSARTSNGSTR
jgi:hypothetical protein